MSTPAPATPAAPAPPASAPAKPAAPPSAAPAAALPLTGDLADVGSVRRESVRARRWSARGGAKVLGDVEVESSNLAGLISVRGKIRAQRFHVNGTLDANGSIDVAGALELAGTARLAAPVQAGSLELKGAAKIGGPLTVQGAAHWKGSLDVAGGITAGSVDFEGAVTASGDLVAPTLTGRLKGPSRVPNLRATQLRLTRPGLFPPMQTGSLTVVRIDAQVAHLEGVTAELVKAEHITVGPGCHIASVEGQLDSVHPSSHVGPESRSHRPYGLSR